MKVNLVQEKSETVKIIKRIIKSVLREMSLFLNAVAALLLAASLVSE